MTSLSNAIIRNIHSRKNPYFDDPAQYFAWRADDVLQEVELIPTPSNPEAEAFVAAAIEHYGLNRGELKALRYFKQVSVMFDNFNV